MNFFDCHEKCPFDADTIDGAVYKGRNYTVFGDSKCQYKIRDEKAKVMNLYIDKNNSENLLIYHSYTQFSNGNTDRRSTNF